jgi:hypothetical protein
MAADSGGGVSARLRRGYGGIASRRLGEGWFQGKCLLLFRQFNQLNQGNIANSCLLLSTCPKNTP